MFAAVLLFDGPQKPARLVEVRIVRPTVERRKTLLAAAGAAAAISNSIGARTMPRQAYEQSAIMTKVGRPPVLRVRHQRLEIFDHSIEVELFEFFRIIKIFTHWIRERRVLAKRA